MHSMKSVLSALLVIGLGASILSQCAFANEGRFAQNHPRRAEVLGRDRNIRSELKADKGQMNGHYGNLMAQDRRIHMQEKRDARQNGGFITKQEKRQLNREENRLDHRIDRNQGR